MTKHAKNQLPMLTVIDVAHRTGFSTKSVRRWINGGELRVHRIGRSLRISEDDLAVFLARRHE